MNIPDIPEIQTKNDIIHEYHINKMKLFVQLSDISSKLFKFYNNKNDPNKATSNIFLWLKDTLNEID